VISEAAGGAARNLLLNMRGNDPKQLRTRVRVKSASCRGGNTRGEIWRREVGQCGPKCRLGGGGEEEAARNHGWSGRTKAAVEQ